MIPVSCAQIAAAVGGELVGVDPAAVVDAGVEIDSRKITAGGLFVAFAGQNVDGHEYVPAVTAAGATVSITTRPVEGSPCIVVADAQQAIGELAKLVISQLPELTVIGLTGSQGKTSTKDLIAQLLAPYGPTVAAVGSQNNEIGHPLTALKADLATRYLVAEMGARHVGDITYLCRITPPKVGLVLNVGHSHIGEFGSQDAIAVAKGEMIEAVLPGGTAILNADDPRVAAMASRTAESVVLWGDAPEATVRATEVELDTLGRAGFTLHLGGEEHAVQLQTVGEHQVANALAAAAAVQAVGLTPAQIAEGLSTATAASKWRMEVHERPDGVTIINDAYNANPESVRAALKALAAIGRARMAQTGTGRTWAVLGPMGELGDSHIEEHDAIGRLVVRLDIQRLLVIGEGARSIHLGASLEGSWGNESAYVDSMDEALELLRKELQQGDVVLVKASRFVGLDRLATALLEEASQ
ncbi:UDP-N-acetylmuramoyl-tripeptide--D-alanyl-D-alanine ligase [Streptomyces sp. SID13031]|uniref:UDP-N-acetylmuramoyl-tripeptide--D-alanyl-D- alanine ligase n=1 Tax=Streptomyces sp. SID13031 TaxID=2706046 RepID=UPI0013C7416E|nr:UDP-N-acetylmuramoyl-tripeptide--D-alanyl-D-alanine ligase [Streptomyces sp. SID13031]NEA36800.1 UDP-N-acetylmuramoyl-tripeptide--D-alanyl-D-alanine ligase [Streptomyces sp. SID13031]